MNRASGTFAAPGGWLRERGMGASVLVAALSTAFGVLLIETTAYLSALLGSDPSMGDSGTLAVVSTTLTVLLTTLSLYVAAIVTANTFATVVAGRIRPIALLRLIGASARSQREVVARQGLIVGVWGALLGIVAGIVLSALGAAIAPRFVDATPPDFTLAQPTLLIPAVGVILTTWGAAWVGSRRVLTVTPLQALRSTVDTAPDDVRARRGRHSGALVILGLGILLLGGGVVVGLATVSGVVLAFVGGLLSFTGLTIAAPLVIPPVLRAVGALFGRSAPARMAAENALRYPERSSRTVMGVVMGVTLVTMFGVAAETAKQLYIAGMPADMNSEMAAPFDSFAAIMIGLVVIAAVIASIGLVNLLTLGVVQRRRELGLLRAIGLSGRQVRHMVLLEAVHITVTALLIGLVLGAIYGWAGAQAVLGSISFHAETGPVGLIAPAFPWPVIGAVIGATAVLTMIAAIAPTRVATRVTPVAALAAT